MDSFRQRLDEIKRLIDDDIYRKRVLLLCQQSEPKPFDEYSSSGSLRRLEKFESSTYSEVLKAIDLADNNKPVVMKIMRALSRAVIKRMPSVTTRGCQAYNDILNELVVTQALSQLHDGVILNGQPNALYRAPFFCFIHEIKVVSGNLNRQLQAARKQRTPKAPVQVPKDEAEPSTAPPRAREASSNASAAPNTYVSQTMSSTLMSLKATNSSTLSTQTQTQTVSTISSGSLNSHKQSGGISEETGLDISQVAKSMVSSNPEADDNQARKEVKREVEEKKEGETDENGKFGVLKDEEQDKNDELAGLAEEERMLMESLPHEYVVSVMRHDGQPLWWMMSNKKLTPEQLVSVLVQVIVGLAIAENVYLYEHRDLHVSNILIKRTSNEYIPFILDGQRYNIISHGVKATIIDATFSRLTHNGKVYHRDLTSTLRAYGAKKTPPKMSLQNRSYRQMVRLTKNKWNEFTPKTNLIWLTYLCETLMKNEVMKSDKTLLSEVKKIRDHTLKVKTTFDLLACFPFERSKITDTSSVKTAAAPNP